MPDKPLEVLLVEDDDFFADAAEKALKAKGCLVSRINNFLDARDALDQRDYDLYFIDGIFPYSADTADNEVYHDPGTAKEFENIYEKMSGKEYHCMRQMPTEVLFSMFDGYVADFMPYGLLIAKKLKGEGKTYLFTSQGSWHGDYMGIWGENAAKEIGLNALFGKDKDLPEYWEEAYKKLKGDER